MPIAHSRFNDNLEMILTYVKKAAYHPFAAEYVSSPQVDFLQLHFSYVFLEAYGVPDPQDICIPLCLIQAGLELHDQIQLEDDLRENEVKKKQLSVLVGDYYSSQYFRYLAERNKVEWIKKWAVVVQKINALKMDMHLNNQRTEPDILHRQKYRLHQMSTSAILDWFQADEVWYDLLDTLVEWQTLTAREDVQMQDTERISKLQHRAAQLLQRLDPEWIRQDFHICWVKGMSEDLLVREP